VLHHIIQFATTRPKRVIAIWAVVVLALTGVASLKGHEVVTDDTSKFLPASSESAQADRFARSAFGAHEGAATVTALVERTDGRPLSAADRAEVAGLSKRLATWRIDAATLDLSSDLPDAEDRAGAIVATAAGPLSPDGRFQLVALQWKANSTDAVAQSGFRRSATAPSARSATTACASGSPAAWRPPRIRRTPTSSRPGSSGRCCLAPWSC
jgi:putative drug exporter of the RND superfamily